MHSGGTSPKDGSVDDERPASSLVAPCCAVAPSGRSCGGAGRAGRTHLDPPARRLWTPDCKGRRWRRSGCARRAPDPHRARGVPQIATPAPRAPQRSSDRPRLHGQVADVALRHPCPAGSCRYRLPLERRHPRPHHRGCRRSPRSLRSHRHARPHHHRHRRGGSCRDRTLPSPRRRRLVGSPGAERAHRDRARPGGSSTRGEGCCGTRRGGWPQRRPDPRPHRPRDGWRSPRCDTCTRAR